MDLIFLLLGLVIATFTIIQSRIDGQPDMQQALTTIVGMMTSVVFIMLALS